MLNKQRKTIRLRGYDYSSDGWYYVTICTFERRLFFGEIKNGKMVLNKYGEIVLKIWQSLPNHHPVELDALQIMPNHLHFILILPACRGIACNAHYQGFARKTPTFQNVTSGSLPCIIRAFKSECSKQIRKIIGNPEFPVWQRNYYEHIIRNEESLQKIRQYVQLNPILWYRDRNNPNNFGS